MKNKQGLGIAELERLLNEETAITIEEQQLNLSPVGAGQRLAEVASQFTLTPEDVDMLEQSLHVPEEKALRE